MYKPLARTYSHAATSCREVWKMQWMMSDPCPAKNKGMKGIKLLTASALSWSFLDCKHEDKDLVNLRTPPPHILGACLACFQHTADDPEILLNEWMDGWMNGWIWMNEWKFYGVQRQNSFISDWRGRWWWSGRRHFEGVISTGMKGINPLPLEE